MNPEIHLFILWEKVYNYKYKIIEDIKNKFTILKVFEIHWNPENYSDNISRFYGQNLPPWSHKQLHCGVGPFTLVIVKDNSPRYEKRTTSRGVCEVNINMFDAKCLYREWTGGGHRVHATNSVKETNHDLALLLGCDANTFLDSQEWDGTIEKIYDDVIGYNGWESISQLFYILNLTIDYVVLRNFECLPEQYHMKSHGDIDLLTNNYTEICLITNSKPFFNEPDRVLNKVKIAQEEVLFDFRHVGDGYYDQEWESSILKNRKLSDKGFYIPDDEDYFYTLLYHAVIHKPRVSRDYINRLLEMAENIGIQHFSYQTLTQEDEFKHFMEDYLNKKGYRYTVPKDPSVYFNRKMAGEI